MLLAHEEFSEFECRVSHPSSDIQSLVSKFLSKSDNRDCLRAIDLPRIGEFCIDGLGVLASTWFSRRHLAETLDNYFTLRRSRNGIAGTDPCQSARHPGCHVDTVAGRVEPAADVDRLGKAVFCEDEPSKSG